ncbi:MAG: recombinase family protein [Chitinophagaceae bacterium]|nr:recombinase family protein [Chitinophagaceae bacterium]
MEPKKRVGIWVRVSADRQVEDESPEHHEMRGRYYAQSKGWEVVEVYRLDALSGKSIVDYPQTKQMVRDIESGRIDALIFSRLARLARNTKELLEFAEFFKKQDADLISLSENIDTSTPAGRLFYTMIAAMATWEREEIAERVAASVPIRAKMGKPLGGAASFGYKWEGRELVIDEKEAPVRKLLYEIFRSVKRKKATATELNNRGYRTRGGAKFTDTTVERLIKDSTAKGVRRANYTRSTGEGKKWVIKDQKDWILIPCPAIVSAELWDECNAILEAQHKKRTKPGPRTVYLLAGYVTCDCGQKMYVYHSNPTYRCKKCNTRIMASDIDEIYHTQLKSFLLTETDLSSYMRQSDSLIEEKELLLGSVRNEVVGLRKKINEYVELRVNKELTPERFKEVYDPLEERLAQVEKQLPELEAEIDFLKIQHLSSDTVLREAKDLYERWPELPFEEKRTIVELITDQILIGKQDITIKLSYLPHTPSLQNAGKGQRNFRGSLMPSA